MLRSNQQSKNHTHYTHFLIWGLHLTVLGGYSQLWTWKRNKQCSRLNQNRLQVLIFEPFTALGDFEGYFLFVRKKKTLQAHLQVLFRKKKDHVPGFPWFLSEPLPSVHDLHFASGTGPVEQRAQSPYREKHRACHLGSPLNDQH